MKKKKKNQYIESLGDATGKNLATCFPSFTSSKTHEFEFVVYFIIFKV